MINTSYKDSDLAQYWGKRSYRQGRGRWGQSLPCSSYYCRTLASEAKRVPSLTWFLDKANWIYEKSWLIELVFVFNVLAESNKPSWKMFYNSVRSRFLCLFRKRRKKLLQPVLNRQKSLSRKNLFRPHGKNLAAVACPPGQHVLVNWRWLYSVWIPQGYGLCVKQDSKNWKTLDPFIQEQF